MAKAQDRGKKYELLQRKVFAAGENIFEEGEPGRYAYLVEQGLVEIYKHRKGHDVLLGTIEAGGLFGEMALLDFEPRMASARARDYTVLVCIPGERCQEAYEKTENLMRSVVKVLLTSLRHTGERVASLELQLRALRGERVPVKEEIDG